MNIKLIDSRVNLRNHLTKVICFLQKLRDIFVAGGCGAGFGGSLGIFTASVGALELESLYALTRVAQSIGFAIECLVAMAAGTAANLEQILAAIQHVGALQHAVAVMTLIAPGLHVLFVIERPQPMLVSAVSFFNRGCAAPVAAVTGRAAEAIWIVCLKQLLVWMRDERSGSGVVGWVFPFRNHVLSG